jgi:hypothetical protein
MSVDSVSKTSSWRDVTWHVEPHWNNRYLLGCGKSNVTLYGYRIPPIILKKTTGVLEIRPKQAHYVWFPPKSPVTTAGGKGLGDVTSQGSRAWVTPVGGGRMVTCWRVCGNLSPTDNRRGVLTSIRYCVTNLQGRRLTDGDVLTCIREFVTDF